MWPLRRCYSPLLYTPVGTEEFSTPQGRVFGRRSCLGCWHNGFNRPVLKHGPRSLTCLRVFGWKTRARNESESWDPCHGEHRRPDLMFTDGSAVKHVCWDPKDGELCLNRVKPEETLVEARSDSDVQIDRRIWV